MFKRIKACAFDVAEANRKWNFNRLDLIELYHHYPFLAECIEEFFIGEENTYYIGNVLARESLILAIKQKRPIFLSGPAGTGKTTYLREQFPATHDVCIYDPSVTKLSSLRDKSEYESLVRPKLVVIDSVEKFTKAVVSQLKKLFEVAKTALVVVTQVSAEELGKKFDWSVDIVEFKELPPSLRAVVLKHHFPSAPDALVEKVSKGLPLHNGLQFLLDGSTSMSETAIMRVKDIIGNILMNSDRDKVHEMLLSQKPNIITLCIYMAEQKLTLANRELVTDHLQLYAKNIDEDWIYAVLAYAVELQKTFVMIPDTRSRRKWAIEDETMKFNKPKDVKKANGGFSQFGKRK